MGHVLFEVLFASSGLLVAPDDQDSMFLTVSVIFFFFLSFPKSDSKDSTHAPNRVEADQSGLSLCHLLVFACYFLCSLNNEVIRWRQMERYVANEEHPYS